MKQSAVAGFTLIEMIIVLVIVGMLVVVLLSALNPVVQLKKSRDVRRKSDLREIKTSLMLYQTINEVFPTSDAEGRIVGCDCSTPPCACAWGTQWVLNNNVFMKVLPADPLASQSYQYSQVSNNSFYLIANLEIDTDSAIPESQARCGVGSGSEYVVCQD